MNGEVFVKIKKNVFFYFTYFIFFFWGGGGGSGVSGSGWM